MLSSKKVALVGAFPPPVHGFSVANEAVEGNLKLKSLEAVRCDLSPGRGDHQLQRSFDFLQRLLKTLAVLMFSDVGMVYLALSGGPRQLIDLFAIAIARIKSRRIIIHHHSFAYINQRKSLTDLVIRFAGRPATHIVLCACMAQRLRTLYSGAAKSICLSNLALTLPLNDLEREQQGVRRTGPLRSVGYLSNITVEKGFLTFIEVAERLQQSCPNVRAIVAGPFSDRESRQAYEFAVKRGVSLEYRGPVYGAAKQEFFSAIDILLFPTRYVNEAEPIVILEAISGGIPVVATARGCISEMLPNEAGRAIDDAAWFDIHNWLAELAGSPSNMDDLRVSTWQSAVSMIDAAISQRKQWLSVLAGN